MATDKPFPDRTGDVFCYIHLWRDRAGEMESSVYSDHREAMEAAGEDWPTTRYVGTIVVPREGQPSFEDWAEVARKHREDATREWLQDARERPKVL